MSSDVSGTIRPQLYSFSLMIIASTVPIVHAHKLNVMRDGRKKCSLAEENVHWSAT